jgi:hypothetical protein
MSFVVRKLRTAEEDTLEAAIWYEERQVGLGEDFLDEVNRAVRALSDDALHYGIRFANVRCKPLHRSNFTESITSCGKTDLGPGDFPRAASSALASRTRYANRLTIPVNVKQISNRSRRHIWIRLGERTCLACWFFAPCENELLTSDV